MHTCQGLSHSVASVLQTMDLGNKKVWQSHLLTSELAQGTDLKEAHGTSA